MRRVPVPSRPDEIRVEDGDWYESMRGGICEECGCRFEEHVRVPGYWWLTRICNGDLVKLK